MSSNVAPLSQNITSWSSETTATCKKYRSTNSIQNTPEEFQPNMEKIVITGDLSEGRKPLEAIVGGYTLAQAGGTSGGGGMGGPPVAGSGAQAGRANPNAGLVWLDRSKLRITSVSEIDYDSYIPTEDLIEPTVGVFYLREFNHLSSSNTRTITIKDSPQIIQLELYQGGVFESVLPIVVYDNTLVNLSDWLYRDDYYKIPTHSTTSSAKELEFVDNNLSLTIKTSKPALMLMCINPLHNTASTDYSYQNSLDSLMSVTEWVNGSLLYEKPPQKQYIGQKRDDDPTKTYPIFREQLVSNAPYALNKYTIFYFTGHGIEYSPLHSNGSRFAGIGLNFIYNVWGDTHHPA